MRKLFAVCSFAGMLALGGCTAAQVTQLDAITASFIQGVQEATAAACGIIPEAAAITSIFDATAGATIGLVAGAVCKLAPSPASARYKALPLRSTAPALIGKTPSGIVVTGWRA